MKHALFLLVLVLAEPVLACEGLQISDPWIREAPPDARVMAGYVRLKNSGARDLRIDAIKSPAFGAVEMHRTVVVNNQMQMLRESDTVLEPGEEKWLAPGGWHLMLFRPQQALAAGAKAAIEFHCGDESRAADFLVRAAD